MRQIFLLLLLSLNAQASIQIIGQSDETFSPDPSACRLSDTCDLKKFRFVLQRKKVLLPAQADKNANFMTDTRAIYETQQLGQIEKYAIVQQIRGCQFESQLESDAKVSKFLNVDRNHMGKMVTYQHKDWQIDNDYPGAIYTGRLLKNGIMDFFYLLNWNTDPTSLDANNSKYYGKEKPTHPVVFATDLPGVSALEETSPGAALRALNSSLEFKTCLFKTSDLPLMTDASGKGVPFAKAIHCFSWEQKYVYDFGSAKMMSPAAIDPICFSQAPSFDGSVSVNPGGSGN